MDLLDGLPHGHASAGPLEHLDVVAAVADRQGVRGGDAESIGDVLEPGGLGDAHRRQVQPGCPADDVVGAVKSETGRKPHEVLDGRVRVADDHAADRAGDDLVDVGDRHRAGEFTLREVPVDAIAHAAFLDGDQRRRMLRENRGHCRTSVERLLMDDLDGRVAQHDSSVGGHDPQAVRVVGRQVERIRDRGHRVRRPAAGQDDVRARGHGSPDRVVHDRADLLMGGATTVDPLQERAVDVERDELGAPVGV